MGVALWDLRRHAVKEEGPAGWGAALLMQRGTVAWMKAWPANDESLAAGGSGPVVDKEVAAILSMFPRCYAEK